jgi:hypothetical protein
VFSQKTRFFRAKNHFSLFKVVKSKNTFFLGVFSKRACAENAVFSPFLGVSGTPPKMAIFATFPGFCAKPGILTVFLCVKTSKSQR